MESYVVLARRYRPKTFEEVLGQEAIAKTLVHAIESGRVAHAYLFAGPRGIGKTSMARILARALCCQTAEAPTPLPCGECQICVATAKGEDLDVIEIDGASNRGIGEVRDLRENARYTPARARFKIYIIDEVHMLTTEAFNALLKILEEPPPHVKFIFATTEAQNVPATILSRCQRFDFRRIPTRTIANHLKRICDAEGVTAEDEALYAVARASAGGMRDSQSLLDQLITLGEGEIRTADLANLLGTVSSERMERLFAAIAEGDDATAVTIYEEVFDEGVDPVEFLKQALAAVRDLLVLLACGEDTDLVDMTPEARVSLAAVAKAWGKPRVMYAIGLLAETIKTVKLTGEGRALVTLALVKLAKAGRFRSLDRVLKDLEELEKRIDAHPGGAIPRAPAAPAPVMDIGEKRGGELFGDTSVPSDGALKGEETVRLSLGQAKDSWEEILTKVTGASSAAGSFLASGRVVGLKDDTLVIGFPASAKFHQKQLEDPDRIHLIEREVAEVLGTTLRIETETIAAEESGGEGGIEADDEEPRAISRLEYEQVGREPIANALKEILGARLINVERT